MTALLDSSLDSSWLYHDLARGESRSATLFEHLLRYHISPDMLDYEGLHFYKVRAAYWSPNSHRLLLYVQLKEGECVLLMQRVKADHQP